jgi:hypothetical protein
MGAEIDSGRNWKLTGRDASSRTVMEVVPSAGLVLATTRADWIPHGKVAELDCDRQVRAASHDHPGL